MTMEVDTSNSDLTYLLNEIRSNLVILNETDTIKETPRAHAWLLTTLSLYGDQFNVLIDLYRLFREQNSYILLSFIIEHILQHQLNEIEKNRYLQQEFQLLFTASPSSTENQTFSYSHLHSLLSPSTRELISSSLTRKWYDELEQNLLLSSTSTQSLNKCREKALACLSFSSSILQLIINTEEKIGFNTKLTSLNILRCLFVQDLLPIALENRQRFDIQSHLCHKYFIYAIEFYIEYFIICFQNNSITNLHVKLEGNNETFQCDRPIEQIDKLMNLAMNVQQNSNWSQFILNKGNSIGSPNRRQQLLELRILIDRAHNSTIRCPLECYIFCISFPIYIQSILNLSSLLTNNIYKDYIFLYSTSSIKTLINKQNELSNFELIEHFSLFVECLHFLQQSHMDPCLKLYQETIEKVHLNSNIRIYQRLLKLYYFYFIIQKSKDKKSLVETIIIDDTPQSPTMQDDANVESTSALNNTPLRAPDIESLIQQLNNDSLESRLQLCSLYSISYSSDKHRLILTFYIDTLIYLYENYSSYNEDDELSILSISSDYCFIPRSYKIYFDYVLDLILQYITPTLILLQIKQQQHVSFVYPKNAFQTLSPGSLRYIYDQKLLGQLLKYIQTTKTNAARWITNNTNNKRKLDDEENKLTDEQFIEKIIQHVSNITQWTNEQRRHAIYTYIIDERHALLQS